jgi:uncharacterized protein with NRDE domain
MCTLLVWKHRRPDYPIVVAANRDEFEGRPSTGPQRLHEQPLVVGGRDEVAGGTWLAVSEHCLIVALTNRRGAGAHDSSKRSRGQLVLDLARMARLADVGEAARVLDARAYNPFVLVALDRSNGIAVQGGDDGLHIAPLADGVHAVTNWEIDAREEPKTRRALELAEAFDIASGDADELAGRLHALLSDHAPGQRSNDGGLCVHRSDDATAPAHRRSSCWQAR